MLAKSTHKLLKATCWRRRHRCYWKDTNITEIDIEAVESYQFVEKSSQKLIYSPLKSCKNTFSFTVTNCLKFFRSLLVLTIVAHFSCISSTIEFHSVQITTIPRNILKAERFVSPQSLALGTN